MPRKTFWPNWDDVTGEWGRLHNEELYDLYSWPNIIRVTKSRIMRWSGLVARMEDRRDAYRVSVRKPWGKRLLQDVGVGVRIILKWIFRKWDCEPWTVLIWHRIGTGVGLL